jgi:hypothetical protein
MEDQQQKLEKEKGALQTVIFHIIIILHISSDVCDIFSE